MHITLCQLYFTFCKMILGLRLRENALCGIIQTKIFQRMSVHALRFSPLCGSQPGFAGGGL